MLAAYCRAKTERGILKPPPEKNELWECKWLIETDTNQPPTRAERYHNTHIHIWEACWDNYSQLAVREEPCETRLWVLLLFYTLYVWANDLQFSETSLIMCWFINSVIICDSELLKVYQLWGNVLKAAAVEIWLPRRRSVVLKILLVKRINQFQLVWCGFGW